MSEHKKYLQHKFVIGLVYPSFLGSVIYNILDKFNYIYMMDNILRYLVFVLVLLVYVMDYLYTDTEEVKEYYNTQQCLLDLTIVGLLYWSIMVILDYKNYPFPEIYIAISLFLSKFINLIWEFSRVEKESFSQFLYMVYSIIYAVIAISIYCGMNYSLYFITIVLSSDILISMYYDKISYYVTSTQQKRSIKKISNTKVVKKINSYQYPFYNDEVLANERILKEIDRMARQAYMEKSDVKPTFSLESLKKLYYRSPKTWIFLENDGKVLGYAHVELIHEKLFNCLSHGIIDENEFTQYDDIYKCNDDRQIIHIGSLVVDKNIEGYNKDTVIYLIACMLDKIVKLMSMHNITRIFAVEYEDYKGRSHFKHKLNKYGFELVGQTKTNNNVYLLDIQRHSNTYFHHLLNSVANIQKKYYENDEKYIEKLTHLFPS